MHMADALLSPAVGASMWTVTAGLTVYCARKVKKDADERKAPLMGVLGAFIFAAQMINFSIPATGSSGHLGGGMILSILLGPYAAFLTIASVLTVQALFFADGGLLALGCNIFNLGFFPCFIAYPFIYKALTGSSPTRNRIVAAAILASAAGLLMGASGVILETVLSGISELPLGAFALLMLPIHLAIGLVEGLVTSAVVLFVWKARPEVLTLSAASRPLAGLSLRKLLAGFAAAAVLTGGILSWFASQNPDGLEWSMFHTSGHEELAAPADGLHRALAAFQEKLAFLPDYDFKKPEAVPAAPAPETAPSGPVVQPGTSVAGLVGAALTLALAGLAGLALGLRRRAAEIRR